VGRLSFRKLRRRRSLDYRLLQNTRTDLWSFAAYRNGGDWSRGARPIVDPAQGGDAGFYVVDYGIATLTGPGPQIARTTIGFDTTASPSYPFSEPLVSVLSRPIPWSSHFHPTNGVVCLGAIWREAQGKMSLAALIAHVGRLLNFEEPPHRDPGFNPAAIAYWNDTLGCRPITPGLSFPAIRLDQLEAPEPAAAPVTTFAILTPPRFEIVGTESPLAGTAAKEFRFLE
jgi:hypothetical protein